MPNLIPFVIERNGREERSMDIYSRLLSDRIIFLGSAINDDVANSIVAQLLYLQAEDPKKDVHIYINSPGGSVSAGGHTGPAAPGRTAQSGGRRQAGPGGL